VSEDVRYAIYFVPQQDSELYRFGAAVLGYDCHTGDGVPFLELGIAASTWADLTEAPRTYGFHATLKAPFRLRPELREADLIAALRRFARGRNQRSAPILTPVVEPLADFIAIVPQSATAPIVQLATDCVTAFDHFRAPMSSEERARRLHAGLSARQAEHLEKWGYPYVLEDFRFHMTLTAGLDRDRRAALLKLLQEAFAKVHGSRAVAIDRIALVRQDSSAARFRVLAPAPFRS
jgi:putative phosphonate metabolism protein